MLLVFTMIGVVLGWVVGSVFIDNLAIEVGRDWGYGVGARLIRWACEGPLYGGMAGFAIGQFVWRTGKAY